MKADAGELQRRGDGLFQMCGIRQSISLHRRGAGHRSRAQLID
jgi:hypothetical protein